MNCGWDFDPIFEKYLILTMNDDSTVVKAEIKEWRQ